MRCPPHTCAQRGGDIYRSSLRVLPTLTRSTVYTGTPSPVEWMGCASSVLTGRTENKPVMKLIVGEWICAHGIAIEGTHTRLYFPTRAKMLSHKTTKEKKSVQMALESMALMPAVPIRRVSVWLPSILIPMHEETLARVVMITTFAHRGGLYTPRKKNEYLYVEVALERAAFRLGTGKMCLQAIECVFLD